MLEEGHFYPRKTMTAEERLWWYSRYFDVVEVNSTFYALPAVSTTTLWANRTPPDFLFNVKAFGLLTGHHVDLTRLPQELRKMLPSALRTKTRGRIANATLGDEARSWAFAEFRKALGHWRRRISSGTCCSSLPRG